MPEAEIDGRLTTDTFFTHSSSFSGKGPSIKKKQDNPAKSTPLRRRAERKLQVRKPASEVTVSGRAEPRLRHELQIHEIELELQNDELLQAHVDGATLLARYTDLYEFAPTGYLILDRKGTIRRVNLAGASLLGAERSLLLKSPFSSFVAPEDRQTFGDFLWKVFSQRAKGSCEVKLARAGDLQRYALIEGTYSEDGKECRAVVIDITARRDAEEKSRARQDELRRVREIEETERRRLARELHDQVGQNLTSLGLHLNLLKDQLPGAASPAARARLDQSVALVAEIMRAVRTVMTDLRSPVLDDFGLVAAAREYVGQFTARTGIGVDFTGEESDLRLPGAVETALFRILQEALTNISKHARATLVTIVLRAEGTCFKMMIADNGCGFDTECARRGWGLRIITERAEAIGGRCRLQSSPGRGSVIEVEVAR